MNLKILVLEIHQGLKKVYTFTSDPTTETTTTATTSPPQSFQDTQIWVRDGKKYVVWQVPGQPFFMRYETTDEE